MQSIIRIWEKAACLAAFFVKHGVVDSATNAVFVAKRSTGYDPRTAVGFVDGYGACLVSQTLDVDRYCIWPHCRCDYFLRCTGHYGRTPASAVVLRCFLGNGDRACNHRYLGVLGGSPYPKTDMSVEGYVFGCGRYVSAQSTAVIFS